LCKGEWEGGREGEREGGREEQKDRGRSVEGKEDIKKDRRGR